MTRHRQHRTGSITRRGDGFRIRLTIGGRVFCYTVKTSDRGAADGFARAKYAELEAEHRRRGRMGPGAHVGDLIARFEADVVPAKAPGTRRAYRDSLKPIKAFFLTELADPELEAIGSAEIAQYLAWRRTHGGRKVPAAPRTIAKDRAVLHRLFAFAEELELRDGNPVDRTEAPKGDAHPYVILTDVEFESLLLACEDPTLRLYVLLCGETGVRSESEALWLRWEDIDLEGGFLRIESGRDGHRTKGGKSRDVPMTQRLRDALRAHAADCRLATYDGVRCPWVFHHQRTRRHYQAGERIRSLYDGVKAAAKRAKLRRSWRLHDLRHRRVTSWLAQGKSAVLVRQAVGHSDLRTTMAYTHLDREPLRDLVAPPPSPAVARGA